MKVIVRTIPGDQADQLEKLINDFLAKPENNKCQIAAAFPSADGETVVLIFNQTP